MIKMVIKHLAIIMDGNRRWAKNNKLQIFAGHYKGGEVLDNIIDFCIKEKIKYLTIYALSSKNIRERSKEELAVHYSLHKKYLERELNSERYKKDGIRFNVFGRLSNLPESEQDILKKAMNKSKKYNKFILNTCIGYDGQEEIVDSVREITKKGINPNKINEKTIKNNLYTKNTPAPEIIIRTGMFPEQRLSGFLLWDSSYSEFFFTKTLWPDFTVKELKSIINNYNKRQRRFGK